MAGVIDPTARKGSTNRSITSGGKASFRFVAGPRKMPDTKAWGSRAWNHSAGPRSWNWTMYGGRSGKAWASRSGTGAGGRGLSGVLRPITPARRSG